MLLLLLLLVLLLAVAEVTGDSRSVRILIRELGLGLA